MLCSMKPFKCLQLKRGVGEGGRARLSAFTRSTAEYHQFGKPTHQRSKQLKCLYAKNYNNKSVKALQKATL